MQVMEGVGGGVHDYVCVHGGWVFRKRKGGRGGSKVEAVVGEIWMVGCKGSGWVWPSDCSKSSASVRTCTCVCACMYVWFCLRACVHTCKRDGRNPMAMLLWAPHYSLCHAIHSLSVASFIVPTDVDTVWGSGASIRSNRTLVTCYLGWNCALLDQLFLKFCASDQLYFWNCARLDLRYLWNYALLDQTCL